MKKSLLVLLGAALFLGSCKKEETAEPEAKQNTVRLAEDATYGKILTDENGMSLYFFSKDVAGAALCDAGGDCISKWPVFYSETLTLDAGLEKSDFATITRADGAKQTTYKGWPLYFFFNDTKAGDVNGENVNEVWFLAKPDYSLMYAIAQLVGKDGVNYLGDYTPGNGATKYITDINGNTLYSFKNDSNGINKFTKPDFSNNSVWPIFHIDLDKIPSVLNASDFAEIDVFGRKQTTYKGWPLYYFGADAKRGDNTGVSVPAPGVWPIANTSITVAP